MISLYESTLGTASHTRRPRKRRQMSQPERLYSDLQAQRAREDAALAETQLAQQLAAAPITRVVLDVIEDSRDKQLDLVKRLSAALHDALYWTHSPEALPNLTSDQEREATIQALQGLIRREGELARSARNLAKSYASAQGELERALLDASATQSESNARLLRLLVDRLERSTVRGRTVWNAALRQRKLEASKQAKAA